MKSEVTANEEKYSKYRVSRDAEVQYCNQDYYVARNWGKENAKAFADKISDKFQSVTYQLHAE
jgi:plasmid stabilization system protein ParE